MTMDNPVVLSGASGGGQPAVSGDIRSTTPNIANKRTGKQWIILTVVSILLLVAVGAAAFFVNSYFLRTPDVVLKKMTQKMANTQTAKFDGNIKAKVKLFYGEDLAAADDVAREKTNFNIDFYGSADLTDPNELKSSLNLIIGGQDLMERYIYFDSAAVGRTAYVKLSGTSTLLQDDKVAPFLNQWVRVDLGKIAGEISNNYPELAKYLEKAVLKTPLSSEQILEIRAALANTGILTFKKNLGDGFVGDLACYHYQVEINKDALRDYIRTAGAIVQDQVSQQYFGQLIDMVGQAAALLSLTMEGLQSYLPARVPSLPDFLLNTLGAFIGAVLANSLEHLGLLRRWSQFRERWFVRDAYMALVLMALWPAALLFPVAVPLGLGQVWERVEDALTSAFEATPFEDWIPLRAFELEPLLPGAELM